MLSRLTCSVLCKPRLLRSHRPISTSTTSKDDDKNPPVDAKPAFDHYCDPENPKKVTFGQISSAAFNVRSGVVKTDLRRSFRLSCIMDSDIFLKMELNQITGSFKERGARQALLRLSPEQRKKGVWAASAGNHALALCYHGRMLGIPINVVMPRHAPLMKIDFCNKLGANVIIHGKDITVSRDEAIQKSVKAGGTYINGYDHIDILSGAGTIGLEILDQNDQLDAILVPVGGGGLIAGVSVAVKNLYPSIQIIGVESESCPSFANSIHADKPTPTPSSSSLADGLAVPNIGVNSFASARDYIDDMVQVSEQSIALAILRLLEWEKVCVEGAGATGIAALLSGKLPQLKGKRVACILSGGNIDSTVLGRCIDRGLVYDHRLTRFKVVVSDRPGGVAELSEILADVGVSVKDMIMERAWLRDDIFSVNVKVVAESRNAKHVEKLEKRLRKRYTDVIFTPFDYIVRPMKPSVVAPDVPMPDAKDSKPNK